ncbi:heat shock 70 kDa protein 13-like [Corticium candelabrum]|uniref:heat shock 70 kDa protein 13-like n=1 Tax=Corticium candelabrum TaxID=121492 RepID=UPI002E255C88|nr:heat shock 70 kDa protein 13-like [Corticium candelabrum]
MSYSVSLFGLAVLALLFAGYIAQNRLPPPVPRIIGIDLGTTFSCVGAYHAKSGHVAILADKRGRRVIPSVVAYDVSSRKWVVGEDAVMMLKSNARNTFYDAKRFIGRSFEDIDLLDTKERYSFEVMNVNNSPYFGVEGGRPVSPEYVGSLILSELKHTAESRLGVVISKAVMSVPAEFDDRQRNATIKAAELAGLEVLRVINEPTAASLAYGLNKKARVSNVLVVDVGGGTLDVSLLNVQGGMFLTMAMAGNNRLGGQDFNQRLLTYVLGEIKRLYGVHVTNVNDLQRLSQAVESVKLDLTNKSVSRLPLTLSSLNGKEAKDLEISRRVFEEVNSDLFLKVLDPIKYVLQTVEMDVTGVDEVVLVGGSTRIPKIRQLIRDFFGGKEPNVSVDPDLAVVSGVSLQAGIIGGAWPLQVAAVERKRTGIKKFRIE